MAKHGARFIAFEDVVRRGSIARAIQKTEII
jgi:hypothetical protein